MHMHCAACYKGHYVTLVLHPQRDIDREKGREGGRARERKRGREREREGEREQGLLLLLLRHSIARQDIKDVL